MDSVGSVCRVVGIGSTFAAWLARTGVDLATLTGLGLACLVSWCCVDALIQRHYRKLHRGELKDDWPVPLEGVSLCRSIGRIERLLYIYSIASGVYGILSAWIILKAFFGWMQEAEQNKMTVYAETEYVDQARPKPDAAELEKARERARRRITGYYLYIYGNALSLIAALILTHAGMVVAAALRLLPALCPGSYPNS